MNIWELCAWALAVFCEFVFVYGAISWTVDIEVNSTRDAKRYNESVRYAASAMNTLSVGMIAGSVIVPVINGVHLDLLWSVIWVGAGIALHIMGHVILGLLKKEEGYG